MNYRELRKKAGLTLQEVADAVGVSKQLISMFESGDKIPTDTRDKQIRFVCANPSIAKKVKIEFTYQEYLELLKYMPQKAI